MDHTGRLVLSVVAVSPVGADNSKCWNPNTPPPLYPNPNYWYYPPQSPEEQQQFWEHYNAMCTYMAQMNAAAYRYSPYPMYPYPYPMYPSDNEEYSGYSSSDEMTYYGQMFKKQAEMAQAARQAQVGAEQAAEKAQLIANPDVSINREPSQSSVNSEGTEKGENADDTSGTDTEVEEDDRLNMLRSIKSVPNINVYNDSDTQTEESEEESEEDSDGKSEVEGDIPHQLSIIYEESEHSDVDGSKKFSINKEQSQSNDSCATLQSDEGDDNDNSTDSTVTVRLPLQFKFSRSSNDEEVATVIVGNSEVESGRATPIAAPENLIITEIVREDSDPDVTATICLKRFKKTPEQQAALDITENVNCSVTPTSQEDSNSNSPVDFWKDIPIKDGNSSRGNLRANNETPTQTSEDDSKHEESDCHSSSTSIQTVKKGLSGSENHSGSETETTYGACATINSPTYNNGTDNEEKFEEAEINDEVIPWNQKKVEDEDEKEDVQGEEEEEQEYEGDDDEEEEEDSADDKEGSEKVSNNGETKVNTRKVASDSESSDEESEESDQDEEQAKQKTECAPLTREGPSKNKEQDITEKKILKQDDDTEDEGESEVSERLSSRASSSEEEEEEEEEEEDDDDEHGKTVDQMVSKSTSKKDIQRPPPKLEKLRSQEESEEDDSGVTSDLSRHISETDTDPECGGELRKMTRYQRAATHSRLFKLLQEECKVEESPEEEPAALSTRKERLSLPLQNQFSVEQESLSSSSGINSPSSPTTTDKLVKELVKSLLSRKKGRHFRKLPLEKLHAAALRILQEDMDPYDTASTSDDSNNLLSPVASTSSSAPADPASQEGLVNPEAYGGNYYDYCRYYSTWGNPDLYGTGYDMTDEYEILPSKAFRILQENTQPERYSSPVPRIAVPVRCPRVSHPPNQPPHPPSESNANSSIPESTSTSQES